MKAFILGILLVSSAASASQSQEFCSNAEGTIEIATRGFTMKTVTATQRIPGQDGSFKTREVLLTDAIVSILAAKPIENDYRKECFPGQMEGIGYGRNVQYKKIKIQRPEGAAFVRDIIGLSPDKKTLEVNMLCEEKLKAETLCETPSDAPAPAPTEGN
ncbi:MAG: hypothetical protein H7318_14315 [Oligoflexus sp.]|nr:hypothetical protein [Oligoflexus sp.]